MGRGCCSLMAAVLLLANADRVRSTQGPCRDCPAGTFCGKTESPACLPCPADSFSSTRGQGACVPCRRCEGVFRTKKACSPTSDAQCECAPGLHCRGPGCAMCGQDCERGQQLSQHGCEDCDPGTFNDRKGGTCRPWTDCSLHGKTVLVTGTTASDVVCGPPSADFSPGTPTASRPAPEPGPRPQVSVFLLAAVSAAALVLLVLLMLRSSTAELGRRKLLAVLKQPFVKPVQAAQEDGCSCGFPEEEEGEEFKL